MNFYAHFENKRKQITGQVTACIRISTDIEGRDIVQTVYVTGKVDARKQAATYGAKPWNF